MGLLRHASVLLASSVFAAACAGASSGETGPTDGAERGPLDSGEVFDSGLDAAIADVRPADVGASDASVADASQTDGGLSDAATVDTGPGDLGAPDGGAASPCGPVTSVSDVAGLMALVPDPFGSPAEYSRRTLTGDIEAMRDISISASDFQIPGDCPASSCMQTVLLGSLGTPAGIIASSRGVDIRAGSRFRMRFAVAFLPPAGFFPQVDLQADCRTPCAGGELRCPDDLTCFPNTNGSGRTYCLACEHRPAPECACVASDDGDSCSYIVGDIAYAGVCTEGACVSR